MAKQNNFSGMKFLQVPKVVIYPAAEGSSSSSRTQTYPVVNECTLDPGLLCCAQKIAQMRATLL